MEFKISVVVERVDLIARLVAGVPVKPGDHEIAVAWIADITRQLQEKRPQCGSVSSGSVTL